MSTALDFDSTGIEAMKDFEPIQPGNYEAMIVESERGTTKDGTGQFVKLTFKILSGEHKNRDLWTYLNMVNKNSKAEEIAQQQLKGICDAVGIVRVKDSSELHNTPMRIKVTVTPAKGQYGPSNKIVAYSSVNASSAPVASVAQAATSGSSAAPW